VTLVRYWREMRSEILGDGHAEVRCNKASGNIVAGALCRRFFSEAISSLAERSALAGSWSARQYRELSGVTKADGFPRVHWMS
jgi:hypothetical protein